MTGRFVYYLTALIIGVVCLLNRKPTSSVISRNAKANEIPGFGFGVFVLILINILKDPMLYPDTPMYADYLKYGYFLGYFDSSNVNIGYDMLNKVFRIFSSNFTLFSIIVAAITTFGYIHTIKKYSVDPTFSLFLFTIISFFPSFWLWRQYIALIFILYSYEFIISRKLLKFLILISLAISMHSTAIVALPLYFIYGIETNKKNIIILLGGFILAIVFFNVLANTLLSNSEYYAHYLETEVEESTMLRLLTKIVFVLLFVFCLKADCLKKNYNYILLLCGMMNILLYAGGSSLYGMYRLRSFFDVSEVLGLPLIASYLHKKNVSHRILKEAVLVGYILMLVYSFYRFIESDNFQLGYNTLF